jgi:hypothetical protein
MANMLKDSILWWNTFIIYIIIFVRKCILKIRWMGSKNIRMCTTSFLALMTDLEKDQNLWPLTGTGFGIMKFSIKFVWKVHSKHLHWYPLIPNIDGKFLSSEEIWTKSVSEMYQFCFNNNLQYYMFVCIYGKIGTKK